MSDLPVSFARLAERLPALASRCADLPCLLGFDGTVDRICRPVAKRTGPGDDYEAFPRIRDFGERVVAADDRSALIEIVLTREKIGGNGPLMAEALAESGLPIDYIGTLGRPTLHPAYREFAERIRVHALGDPAVTHALEFENGKVMLTSMATYEDVNAETLDAAVDADVLMECLGRARLCGLLNWTCLPGLGSILARWRDDLLPQCPPLPDRSHRVFFFDLADPSQRSDAEMRDFLAGIPGLAPFGRTVLGLNYGETLHVCRALDLPEPAEEPETLQEASAMIRSRLDIDVVMTHPCRFAACATEAGTCAVPGPYTPHPAITTGAGDHLNAGFCLGLLLELDAEDALRLGVLFSGFYVRRGRSPRILDLPGFVDELQSP